MKKWMLPLLVGLMLSLTACGENQDARLPAAGDAQSAGGEKEVWQLSIVQPPEKLDYEEERRLTPRGLSFRHSCAMAVCWGTFPMRVSLWTHL